MSAEPKSTTDWQLEINAPSETVKALRNQLRQYNARMGHTHEGTGSFQAPDFYQKLGCEIIATLDGLGNGHQKFYLRKSL